MSVCFHFGYGKKNWHTEIDLRQSSLVCVWHVSCEILYQFFRNNCMSVCTVIRRQG